VKLAEATQGSQCCKQFTPGSEGFNFFGSQTISTKATMSEDVAPGETSGVLVESAAVNARTVRDCPSRALWSLPGDVADCPGLSIKGVVESPRRRCGLSTDSPRRRCGVSAEPFGTVLGLFWHHQTKFLVKSDHFSFKP